MRTRGLIPTASIKLAQKLAQKLAHRSAAGDPSARLLQRIERSEADDAEITALEEAEIDEVRAALPPGVGRPQHSDHASSGQAEAKVVPIRARRRLSRLGLGGSLIGIAASVLLFITIRPDRLEQADVPPASIEPRPPIALDAESADADILPSSQTPLPELSRLDGKASAGNTRNSAELADFADVPEAGNRVVQSLNEKRAQPLLESRELVPREEAELDLSSGMATSKAKRLQRPPLPAPRPMAADAPSLQDPPSDPAVLLELLADLKAILLVDAVGAPPSLRALSNRLPEGRLAVKLKEAQLRASSGKVIALVAFERDGAIVEAALVETPSSQTMPDLSAQTITGFAGFAEGESAMLLGSETSFELIELSAGR